jgi:predicted permease
VIAAGIVVNLGDLSLPTAGTSVLDTFGAASPFLVAVGTGVLFVPAGGAIRRALGFAGARLLVGAVAATTIVLALGLDGADRGVLLLLGVAPLGFVIVAFASVEKLDVELATQTLAVSLVASFGLSILVSLAVG